MKGAWRKLFTASILGLALAAVSSAGPINLLGGTFGTVPGGATNDYITAGLFPGPQISGYYGAQVEFDVDTPSVLTIDFFGAEAEWINVFMLLDFVSFTHPGGTVIASSLSSPLDSWTSPPAMGTGIPPFTFSVNSGDDSVANGDNPDDFAGTVAGPNFFASCDPFAEGELRLASLTNGINGENGDVHVTSCGNTVYLFLDDGGADLARLVDAGEEVIVIDDLSTGIRNAVHPKARLVVGDVRHIA